MYVITYHPVGYLELFVNMKARQVGSRLQHYTGRPNGFKATWVDMLRNIWYPLRRRFESSHEGLKILAA